MSVPVKRTYIGVGESEKPASPGAGRRSREMTQQSGEIKKLSTLVEVSQALSGTLKLGPALHRMLDILEAQHGFIRGQVTLLNEDNGELVIEASNGLAANGK